MTGIDTEALMLRAVDFGESDRILHLLTPDAGRLSAIAKGARRSLKRFPGTLDFFNHLQVRVERRRPDAMARLEHARLLRTFFAIRQSPSRFAMGCYLMEMLDRLAPEEGSSQDQRSLFHFALAALGVLEAREPDLRLRILLELRGLDVLGLRPELRHCVRCATDVGGKAAQPSEASPVGFHIADGGPVCGGCAQPGEPLLRIHVGTLRVLERSLDFDLTRLERLALGGAALREARTLVARFLRFHVGLDLRSEGFLDARLTLPEVEGKLPTPDASE